MPLPESKTGAMKTVLLVHTVHDAYELKKTSLELPPPLSMRSAATRGM